MTRLRIKQIRSGIGKIEKHKRILRALGLKHPGNVVEHSDSPTIRGMVEKVKHLVSVEIVEEESGSGET